MQSRKKINCSVYVTQASGLLGGIEILYERLSNFYASVRQNLLFYNKRAKMKSLSFIECCYL